MDLGLYSAFVGVSILLIVVPGPNVLFIVSQSLSQGSRRALFTVAGTGSAMALQLAIAIAGMNSLMVLLADWFELFRWCGVAYLILLGVAQWRNPPVGDRPARESRSARRLFLRGFLVSLSNPKTLVFFAAFLPQFVSRASAALPQLALLSATFLLLATVLDSGYALLGGKLQDRILERHRVRIQSRISGSLLIGAGVGLALTRRSSS